ncbi:ParB/RepB/Spo0J family partition protein [Micrococcus terreus]|uniref:ParB/RepB/Spo0J family partition protein n=1 Tax=Micrococcus terreus TaxID=574650 RepID=UPI00254FFD99|nr:ParB/RepB/Spo0J family partition protein [Micrococcus terreus]WOO98213.1 ParB/RepB/Spo0J family partition protein [Micrococcus terreus]
MNALSQSTYEPMLVEKLRPHPRNIRHEVKPSDELVDSIRSSGILQPLVVAPHPTLEGDYTVIAGHHRLAAAKKAGLLEVPAVIRHDLLGDEKQIAAMVAENLRRQDLTVTEEADAYQAMLGFEGWDVKRVARETGSAARRVRERVKIATMADEHRRALDAGQLTLERALAIAALDDHPDLQEQLVEQAGEDSHSWEYYRKQISATAAWRKEMPKVRKELEAAGVKIVDRPDVPEWRHDFPYDRPSRKEMSFDQAAAEGWMAILDDDCDSAGAPVWVREKPSAEEAEAALSPEEIAAREAAAQRRARQDEVEAALRTVVEIETEWIKEVCDRARRGEKDVITVIRAWFGHELVKLFAYGGGSQPRQNLASLCDIKDQWDRATTDKLEECFTGNADFNTCLFTLISARSNIANLHAWRSEPGHSNGWLALRADLGWELTDAEKDAQALAAELYPAKPVPATDQDEDLDDEDGDDQ